MWKRPIIAFALSLAALTGSLALPVAAQEPAVAAQEPAREPGVFGEVIEVRLINLEVVVTDSDGRRITGLTPDQFRLLVDGDEVPIEYFTEIRSGIAMEQPGVEVGMELAPGTRPGEPVGTSYLIFVDEFFSLARDRDIVLDAISDDLATLGPRDRVAVVAFDGRNLDMLSSWTSSPEEVRQVLADAKDRPTGGLTRLAERNRFDDAARVEELAQLLRNDDRRPGLENYLTPEERFYASMLAGQVEHAVEAAAASLRSFAAPPGRKVMLLASGGWPFLPADFVVSDNTRPMFYPQVPGGGELFRPLTETANRLGYTLYPIDVPGFDRQVVDARVAGSGSGFARDRASALLDQGRRSEFDIGFLREQETHYALEFVAEQTGGRAFLNSARRDAFEATQEDTRSYYWLGFTPSWQGDDSYHDVRVQVTDPELRVRSRSGFLDLSRRQETSMQVESALLFGNPPSENLLALSIERPEKTGWKKMEVPVTVRIPLEEVVFLPTAEDRLQARLELRIAVVDSRGERAEIPVIPLFVDAETPPEAGDVFTYRAQLKMRREPHRLVVSVYDQASGNMLSGTAEVSP